MNIHESYFSFTSAFSPLPMLDRWLNPFRHSKQVTVKKHNIDVEWSQRAESQLSQRSSPLIMEMQIYFSCVIKKRVLFHDEIWLDTVAVGDHMEICYRAVESNSCDPVEFANNFPVKGSFGTDAASKMHPKKLSVDFKNGDWVAEFRI